MCIRDSAGAVSYPAARSGPGARGPGARGPVAVTGAAAPSAALAPIAPAVPNSARRDGWLTYAPHLSAVPTDPCVEGTLTGGQPPSK